MSVRSSASKRFLAGGLYLARRLGFALITLLAVVYLSFFGLDMARGTPLGQALLGAAGKSGQYVLRLARADLGLSPAASYSQVPLPVSEVLGDLVTRSVGLLAVAMAISLLVGALLGTWAARQRRPSMALFTLLTSLIGVSLPSFFIALLLQVGEIHLTKVLGVRLLPVGGFGWDRHLILPAVVLSARPVAQITRVAYLTLSEVLAQDYVRTARSKGLSTHQVMWRHVYRNVAIPVLTTWGTSLRFALSSLPVVELFFGWPGMGFYLLRAISQQDDNLTVALVLCLGVLFIAVNLILDATYRLIDPRLRGEQQALPAAETGLYESLVGGLGDLIEEIAQHPWVLRLRGRRPEPLPPLPQITTPVSTVSPELQRAQRRRAWLRSTIGNLPFVLGGVLLVGLTVLVLFGPQLSPHNPYTTQGLKYENGVLSVPPFPPSPEHPWGTDVLGRDIMSLIFNGAQRTLTLALFVVLARMAVGLVLGALAGWSAGRALDRLIMALAEIVAAFPALLLAMVLILAVGIREGPSAFIIALCFVGWGEVMQFVRGQVISVRPRPYIESAVATGLRAPQILIRHVLPNLLPSLVSLSALEMGAVLMLLGELGFIGIFIGGGAFAELDVSLPPYHYSDVPEWGALLSNVRLYARTYTWTAFFPAAAFFVAILAFNLFGEGLRQLIEGVGVGLTRLLNRYALAGAILLVATVGWVRGNVSPISFYRQQAAGFDGQRALADVHYLAGPELDGRLMGQPGIEAAAEYIAAEFEKAGLQAAGEELTFFQTRDRAYQSLDGVPSLQMEDGGPALAYRRDFAEYVGSWRNLGRGHGRVRWLGFSQLTEVGNSSFGTRVPALQDLDYSQEVLLLLSEENAALVSERVPRQGVLVVPDDQRVLTRRRLIPVRDPTSTLFGTGRVVGWEAPMMWISEEAANRLLAGTGHTVAELREMEQRLVADEIVSLQTGVTVTMEIEGTLHDRVPTRHVIGFLPGASDSRYGGLNDKLVVVLAQYDGVGRSPDGDLYPGANDNASGVALMLEVLRSWREQGYQPLRSFLFVAYAGEGHERAQAPDASLEVADFLKAKHGFASSLELEAIVFLRGVGGGAGDRVEFATGGSLRLGDLFTRAAKTMGVPARRAAEPIDISIVFGGPQFNWMRMEDQEAPTIGITWDGYEVTSHQPDDTVEKVSPENLELAGRVTSLALMVLGREVNY